MSQAEKRRLTLVGEAKTSIKCPVFDKQVTRAECQSQCVIPQKNINFCSETNCPSQFRYCADCILAGKGVNSGSVVDPVSGKCANCNGKVEKIAIKLVAPIKAPKPAEDPNKESLRHRILLLDPEQIEPMPGQPRIWFDPEEMNSLIKSIGEQEQYAEVRVIRISDGKYRLVDGERRWRAHKMLGKKVKAIIDERLGEGEVGEALEFERSVTLNLHRSNHTPLEKALAMDRLRKPPLGRSVREIAVRFGCTEMTVRNHLVLLDKLHPEVQELMYPKEGRKPLSHTAALFLTSLFERKEEQVRIALRIVKEKLDAVEGKLAVIKAAKELGVNVGRGLEKNRKPSDRIANLKNGIRRANVSLEGFRSMSEVEIAEFFRNTPSKGRDEILGMIADAMSGLAAIAGGIRLAEKRTKKK